MKSKRTLFRDLAALEPTGLEGIGDRKLDHPRISNETYGRKSFVYVTFAKGDRTRMEQRLATLGHRIQPDYWPGSSVSEIQVTYFKGWHWNE